MKRFTLCSAAAVLYALAATSHAQARPTAVEGCIAIESDAERLSCYDAAAGRDARTAREADAAAAAARLQRQAAAEAETAGLPAGERAQRTVSDLFRRDTGDAALANAGKGSLFDSRWELAKDSKLGTFNFRAYKPVYLLPAFWSSDQNTQPRSSDPALPAVAALPLDDIETKFQLSFKTKALENLFGDNGDLWMAYTQSSRWQVYNADNSRPFRETNYEPEILLAFRNNYSLLGWKGRLAAVGINHQSNGRADPLSRSWNRVMFNIGLDREDWALTFRPWIRISDGDEDENPGIEDYVGRGDVTLVHTRDGHVYTLMARHSLRGGDRSRGALQFDWGFPIADQFRGHVQVFSGYGESLIDYDHRATYVGLGISLLDWY